MTPTQLDAAGRTLYGQRYKGALAEALGVDKRTLQRMVSGETPIPVAIELMVDRFIEARWAEVQGRKT